MSPYHLLMVGRNYAYLLGSHRIATEAEDVLHILLDSSHFLEVEPGLFLGLLPSCWSFPTTAWNNSGKLHK